MANNESKVLTTNSFEDWRRSSNEVSYHLGDIDQFDARIGDKVYTYSAAANQSLFIGGDSASKILRFELASEIPIDVLSTVIFTGTPTIASNWIAGKTVYQGSVGSETFTGTILYVNTNKVALVNTTGTFSASVDLTQTTDSTHQTIANANLVRSFSESYTTSYAKVYNAATEQAQSTAQVGFHVPNLAYTITLNGTPTIPASFSEGATVYQGTNYAGATFTGTILNATTSTIYLKTVTGTFSASTMLKELSDSGSDRIIAARITSGAAVDSTFGTIIELHTLASASAAIKLVSTGVVDAIKELQDDIGTVESLTTSAGDLHLAINEHDAELGTITAAAMGTTASTVSTAIAEHETQIGNVDITAIASGNNTHTGALVQLHTEVGSLSLNTSATDLTAAINEHESDIGNMTLTGLTATNLSAGQRELRTELGDVLTIDDATGYAAVSASAGLVEIQGKLGNVTAGNMGTTASTVVTAILENQTEIGVIGSLAAGITADRTNLVAAVNELQGDIGVAAISGLSATTLRGAVNELRVELGDVGAINDATGYAATTGVTGLTEIQGKIGEVSASTMGTTASTLVTAMSEVHTDVDARLIKDTTSAQTITGPITYGDGTNLRQLTFANNTVLDISNGTLLVSAAGNVANFGSAFLNLNATAASENNVNIQGIQVDRSAISGGAPTHDVRLQWDETRVANDPEEAWELQGLDTSKASNTSSIVTRYNAFNLIADNTESGINVTWDSSAENFDFNVNDPVLTFTGDVTGSGTVTNLGNTSIALTVAANSIALGTDTTGNYVATIAGTANEITVAGSGSETAGITISLPDDVTIGDDLIVTDALSVGGISTLTGNTTIGGTLQVNGNVTLGNAASDTVTITGDLIVQGDETTLNTSTLEVEDTIIMMGTAGAEPSTGGFGIETRLFTSTSVHSPAASNITGTHSLVYNFAANGGAGQWEADGSLVLSSATLGVPGVKVTSAASPLSEQDLGSTSALDFNEGTGITILGAVAGSDINVTITNTDRGSQQNIWKNITADSGGTAAANSNTDTLTITGGTSLASARSGDTITINHSVAGANGTFGETGTEDGKYIKSVVVDAQGHVTAVTADDFDDRYAPTHETHPGDDISLDTGTLAGATIISDIDFNITTNTEGHVTDATLTTLSTRELNLHELADTDWGFGGSEPADAAIAIYDQTSNTWRDYVLSGDVTMNDVGACVVADNSHAHTYAQISGTPTEGNGGLTTINFTSALNTKLSGIETSATADQTNAEIRTAVGAATDSNIFTDTLSTKLSGIATGATNTAAPHYTSAIAVGDGGLTTNNFTNEDHTKLNGIATSANLYTLPAAISGHTSANTASKVVSRDGSGNFSATTITASLTGNASGSSGSCTGLAATATALATARTIGGVSFNGTANINLPGVNTTGSQDTTGHSSHVNIVSNQSNTAYNVLFHSGNSTSAPDTSQINDDGANNFSYNPSSNNLTVSNYIYATDVIASSDMRLKDKVGTLDNALDKVCALDGFLYTWNDKAKSKETSVQIGVSAQQVQEVLPEAVEEGEDGYLGVKYDKLVPLLIESIKELRAEVEELKSINSQEGKS
jgi:hypothetical protein